MQHGPRANLTTVESHILEMQRLHPSASGDFTSLLNDITFSAKIIAREVSRAGLADILGATGDENVQGEAVQKLDDFADRTLMRFLGRRGQVCVLASEENAEPLYVEPAEGSGRYVVLFDPLDGSSNIDANVSVGTIFSIYRRTSARGQVAQRDVLQPGRNLVAAGYVI